jgi:hypothetical protein
MAAIGGSIEAVSLRGRLFSVPADQDTNRKLGGFENEVQTNGNGTARLIKTRVAWSISDLTVEVDDTAGDHEFIQSLADGKDYFTTVITYASGEVYSGTGQIVGEIQTGSQNTTCSVSLQGTGVLKKQ